jgi:4,5-DOPA dioxygenase extradiol
MEREKFIKMVTATTLGMSTFKLNAIGNYINKLPASKKLPVLFTSHGNPMDIPLPYYANPFLSYLGVLGKQIRKNYEVKAILVVSAHWCTKGSFVNVSPWPETIYDYYGFPENYYTIKYPAPGAPEIAKEVANAIPQIKTTTEWGFDHGNWPILRHLYPNANIPVFQLSIDYYKSAQYHFDLAVQLKKFREKGVLIIGSGAIVHNLKLASERIFKGNTTIYGWDKEFDDWAKQKVDARDVNSLIAYEKTKLGNLAAPTPDHYLPLIYSMALLDSTDEIRHTYESLLPAFSDRSFIIESQV